jgi:hypothetical protein
MKKRPALSEKDHLCEERNQIMTTIQPEGENLRKAVRWISEEKKAGSTKSQTRAHGRGLPSPST